MARTEPTPRSPGLSMLTAICVIVAVLYLARDVFIPIALAILLSFLLAPVVHRVERLRTGRPVAVVLVVLFAFGLIGLLGYVVTDQVLILAGNVDQYKDNVINKVQSLRPQSGVIDKVIETAQEVQEKVGHPTTQDATTQNASTQPASATPPADGKAPTDVAKREPDDRARLKAASSQRDAPARAVANPATMPTRAPKADPVPVTIVEPQSQLQSLAKYLGLALSPLGTLGIVIVFVIFMLLQREDLRNRLIRLVGKGQLTVTTQALDDASTRISKYLLAQAIVNGTYGCAIGLGLWIIGFTLGKDTPFPSVILWALLCALLRFIPYIGPWIGAAFPLVVAFAVYPGFAVFGATLALFVVIELISNNLMEPWLYGSSTGMSAVAVLVAAVFWAWLWGPIGLLLSTPLTAILVVIGKHVPQLAFFDILLGDDPALTPAERMYQRLLALDAEESAEMAREYWRTESLEAFYDTVLMPALAMAEHDRQRGQLDDQRDSFVRQTIREIIDELGDEERARVGRESTANTVAIATGTPAPNGKDTDKKPVAKNAPPITTIRRPALPKDCKISVIILPAHDEADEICGLMLTQLLEQRGYCISALSQNALASEKLGEIDKQDADVIVISALPPSAVAHTRYLRKRVSAHAPEARLVIGLWLSKMDPNRAKERIAAGAPIYIGTTLAAVQNQIDHLAAPLMSRVKSESPS